MNELYTKSQRRLYTIASCFISAIFIVLLDELNVVKNSWILFVLFLIIPVVAYTKPSIGRKFANLFVSWSIIGARGRANPEGVRLSSDIAQGKTDIDEKIDPQVFKRTILFIFALIVFIVFVASLLNK